MNITHGVIRQPQRILLHGQAGVGKTTFASQFPRPLFIDTEQSTTHLDVYRFDPPTSWNMLLDQVRHAIKHGTHLCETLVIDSIDWAEQLCIQHVINENNFKSIESPGYGRGYVMVDESFRQLLDLLTDLTKRGVHVLLIAHTEIKKFESPELDTSFDRYVTSLSRKTNKTVQEWADLVLFAAFHTEIKYIDGKPKGRGGTERVLYTRHTAAYDAKNRHGLPPSLPLMYSAIAPAIGLPTQTEQNASASQPQSTNIKPIVEVKESPSPQTSKGKSKSRALRELNALNRLLDLMKMHQITDEELVAHVAERGYFPADTPIANYAPEFINGVLVAGWDKVKDAIIAKRTNVPF